MYSLDFRRLAISIYKKYKNYRKSCDLLSISLSTLHRWVSKGIQVKKRTQFQYRKFNDFVKFIIVDALSKNAFLTLKKLQMVIVACTHECISVKMLGRILKKLGYSKKKAYLKMKSTPTSNEKKNAFSKQYHQINKTNIVSLDECYFSENVLPLRGYSPRGERVIIERTTMTRVGRSLLMAVSGDGLINYTIYKGPVNKERFLKFVLNSAMPKRSTFVLDNVAFHKNAGGSFQQKGYDVLYSPPYSPEFNPIENLFFKIKNMYRSLLVMGKHSVEECIHTAIQTISFHDIVNTFHHVDKVCSDRIKNEMISI